MAAHPLREFTEDQRDRIEAAVAAAEAKTSAEIVVAVAGRSGRYDRAEDIFGVVLGLLAVTIAWILFQSVQQSEVAWQTGMRPTIGLIPVLAIFAFWTFAGALLATQFPVLAKPLIGRGEMQEEVERRGAEAFHTLRVGSTADRAAILVYVSLFERIVWVCPDHAVAEKLPDEAWAPIAKEVVDGFKSDRPVEAIIAAVEHAGGMLAEQFPERGEDTSDLSNTPRMMQ
jgi:putative membrane protein